MKKTAFDKIVVGFVILVVLIFSLLMIYSISIAQRSVLSERKTTMKNEISLLVDSSITEYQNGTIDNKTLYSDLQHTATTLDMEIWLTDDKSNIVFKSQASESEKSGSSDSSGSSSTGSKSDSLKNYVDSDDLKSAFCYENTLNGYFPS